MFSPVLLRTDSVWLYYGLHEQRFQALQAFLVRSSLSAFSVLIDVMFPTVLSSLAAFSWIALSMRSSIAFSPSSIFFTILCGSSPTPLGPFVLYSSLFKWASPSAAAGCAVPLAVYVVPLPFCIIAPYFSPITPLP